MSLSYTFTDVPAKCMCKTTTKKPCHNPTTYVYEFSSGLIKYSCGINCHKRNIIILLKENETVNIFRKLHNSMYMKQKDALSCFDIAYDSSIFFGPFNKRYQYSLNLKTKNLMYSGRKILFDNLYDNISLLITRKIENERYIETNEQYMEISQHIHDEIITLREVLVLLKKTIDKYYIDLKELWEMYYEYIEAKRVYDSLFIIKLPWKIKNNQDDDDDDDDEYECSICLDTVNNENEGGFICCGHNFHNKCLYNWTLHNKKTCPNCRKEFDIQKYSQMM